MILYINGTDRTDYLIKSSLFIRKSLSNQTDVCDFVFHDSSSGYKIEENDFVVIEENSTNIFAGYVVSTVGTKIGVGTSGSSTWQVTCKDVSILADSPTFDTEYISTSDEDIATALINGYFTFSSDVTWSDSSVDIEFRNETLRECLNKLAQATSSYWFIDSDSELHWVPIGGVSFSSKTINSQNYDEITAFPPLKNSRIQRDSSNIINKVKFYGGVSENAIRVVETLTFTSGNYTYKLDNAPIQSVRSLSYYDGGQKTYVFGNNIGYFGSGDGSKPVVINQAYGEVTLESILPDNGSTVTLDYYYQTDIYYEVNNYESQSKYGVYEKTIIDQTVNNQTLAESKAQSIVDEYAFPRETISVEVATSGFTPGDIIYCYIPELDILPVQYDYLAQENNDLLLLENSSYVTIESNLKQIVRQIQEVSIRYDGANNQLFSNLTIGKTSLSLIKTLGSLQAFSSPQPSKNLPARLSNFTPDLGVVTAGLGLFTDGGTATFSWSNYAGHSGVIVGVEDYSVTQRGVVSVIDNGIEKARLGYLSELGDIGTITPSGWGIYTENGYFTGYVYGSTIEAGTVKGNLVTGGTVTGNLISGGTVTGALIYAGTIATSLPPINSGNPGVLMDSTGLYGYGSAGLTFRLSSNPAIKPYFSSGTITEVVYEVSTNAVIRTGTTNPRVQIDNSGIFGYDSIGTLRFAFDTGTGYLQATNGSFSGTVTSSLVSAGTVSGARVTGGTVTGSLVTAGTITSMRMTSGTITAVALNSNTLTGGTITGNLISGGTVTAGTITGNRVIGGTIQGTVESSGLVFRNNSLATNIMSVNGYVMNLRAIAPIVSNDSYLGIAGDGFNSIALTSGTTINDEWTLSITSSGSIAITKVNGGSVRYL